MKITKSVYEYYVDTKDMDYLIDLYKILKYFE